MSERLKPEDSRDELIHSLSGSEISFKSVFLGSKGPINNLYIYKFSLIEKKK